jgi:putative Holliday junction resolvase
MGRILAIDYGQKRIGIAVSDPLKMIAGGLTTVGPHEIYKFLEEYFRRENVECVVLGLPKQMNNQPSEAFKFVKEFETAFRRKFPDKKMVLEDERFTSKLAMDAMIQGGMKKSERRNKENIDRISAVILLQSYMERQSNVGK